MSEDRSRLWLAVLVSVGLLAFGGYAAHGRLAASRPAADHLTLFYLVVAVGGAAGGMLNGLLAPLVFDRVLEYPLTLGSTPCCCSGYSELIPAGCTAVTRDQPPTSSPSP